MVPVPGADATVAIAAGVGGAVAMLLIIGVVVFLVCRARNPANPNPYQSPDSSATVRSTTSEHYQSLTLSPSVAGYDSPAGDLYSHGPLSPDGAYVDSSLVKTTYVPLDMSGKTPS